VKTRIRKWGNSQGLRLLRYVLRKAHSSVGHQVEIVSRDGAIVVRPGREVRGKHDLKQLVSRMPHSCRTAEEDWGGTAGREVW